MELAKKEYLRQALEELKERTGLDDNGVKRLFIQEYLLGEEKKSVDEMFSELLHGKKEEE